MHNRRSISRHRYEQAAIESDWIRYLPLVLDANIDAHLLDFNVDENLSFQPYFENDAIFNQNLGIKLKITL